ncbi:MAG: CHAT domain-containing protein [Anaerolineales bacterium]|nr:CHAT domain-containing protein [Anaerolineales bacterium]
MGSNIFTFRLNVENNQQVLATKSGGDDGWAGNPNGKLGFKPKKQQQIQSLCQAMHNNTADKDDVRNLGNLLFSTLFDDSLRVDFLKGYNHVRNQPNGLLRLELDINEAILPELAALPWEFMCVPTNNITSELWLGTDPNVVLSRRSARWQALPQRELAHDEPIRIAVIVANPSDKPDDIDFGDLWQQVKQLERKEPTLYAARLETQPTKENLDALLEGFKPHIFHFIGYGRSHQKPEQATPPEAQIAVLHDSGQAKWVSAAQFGTLFARHRPAVVLFQNAASDETHPVPIFPALACQAMTQDIAVAVALQYPLENTRAHRFCLEFYQRLAKNEPVDKSVQEGRGSISDADWYETRDFASPMLHIRVANGHLFSRQPAPPIASLQPPDAELVRRALLKLNYNQQETHFQGITFKPQRMGAFLITAPTPNTEPYWLLHKLVTMLPGSHVQDEVIKIDMNMADSPAETALWWETVADFMGLNFTASQQEIVTAVNEARAYKNLIFIFDNVGHYPGCVQIILDKFWQPLSQSADHTGQQWQLLFLVESQGRLGEDSLEVTELSSPTWQPTQAIPLPSINKHFQESELQSWLLKDETKAIEPIELRLNHDPQALLQEIMVKEGEPRYVMRAIGHLCQISWQSKKREWCKKYE